MATMVKVIPQSAVQFAVYDTVQVAHRSPPAADVNSCMAEMMRAAIFVS